MEDKFIECEHCQHRIPSEKYKSHLVSDPLKQFHCLGQFCKCRHCELKMPVEQFHHHIKNECPKLYTTCQFSCTHWDWGDSFEVKDELDHYLNKCPKLRSESQRQEVMGKRNARCPVCMRLALERNAESQHKCDFCDPILTRSQVIPKGVSLNKIELLSKDREDDFISKNPFLQGSQFESKRRNH